MEHLIRNADVLRLSTRDRVRLAEAYRMSASRRRADRRRADEIAADVQRGLMEEFACTLRLEAREPEGGVVQWNDAGAVRLSSRDGLTTLRQNGRIEAEHWRVGMIYRRAYEARAAGVLRSQLDATTTGGGGGTIEGLVIGGFIRAHQSVQAEYLERAVIEASRGDPSRRAKREIRALREIAGEGKALSSLANGGAMKAVYLAALIRALDACAAALAKNVQRVA